MCHIQFNPLSPWLKHSHSFSRRSRLFLIILESSSCSALLRLTLYFPQHKGLSHKWKLVQSHLPRLTVSFSSRVPFPITLAGVFPPVSALSVWNIGQAVGNQPLTVLSIGGCGLVCMWSQGWYSYYSSCSSSVSHSAARGLRECKGFISH